MEPSGRNRWQPIASRRVPKTAQTSRSATGGNPPHAYAYADRTLDTYTHDERDPLAAWVDWYVSTEYRDDPGYSRSWS
jgi:hypothetical protein